eukprot:1447213-Rhodomonas_salina.2
MKFVPRRGSASRFCDCHLAAPVHRYRWGRLRFLPGLAWGHSTGALSLPSETEPGRSKNALDFIGGC